MINYQQHIIAHTATVKDALSAIDQLSGTDSMNLFVIDDQEKIIGSVTDGDIRRGLIHQVQLADPVEKVMHRQFTAIKSNGYSPQELKAIKQKGIRLIPILDDQDRLKRIINLNKQRSFLPVDAVIMAGGEGKRLRPLTEKVPKPLLQVGEKPILEHNIDRLAQFGIDHITLTIKYLGDQIKTYFQDGTHKGLQIAYIEEAYPMGTAGSLKLISHQEHNTLLMMNSDLLTNIDYEDFYMAYVNQQADLAVATIPYEVKVPYAVMETSGGKVHSFKEKPTYTYYSNAGIYLFDRQHVDTYIPDNQFFDATDFMEALLADHKKIISYPIRSYWLDIGKHEDYQRAQEDIHHIAW